MKWAGNRKNVHFPSLTAPTDCAVGRLLCLELSRGAMRDQVVNRHGNTKGVAEDSKLTRASERPKSGPCFALRPSVGRSDEVQIGEWEPRPKQIVV